MTTETATAALANWFGEDSKAITAFRTAIDRRDWEAVDEMLTELRRPTFPEYRDSKRAALFAAEWLASHAPLPGVPFVA